MTDKYVRDMNPQELRAHMRRLQAMRGWHDPLADSMYAEIQRLDSAILDLMTANSSLAAAAIVPDEYALVPKEPTDEMLRAGVKAFQHTWYNEDTLADWREAYKAQIAAAPHGDKA